MQHTPSRSLSRVLVWALLGHACLLAAALRHHFVWGEGRDLWGVPLPVLLGAAEGGGVLLFALLAGVPYARAARGAGQHGTAYLTAGGCALLVAATLVPPFLSTDVFDYLARGRVEVVHGANPYTMPPAQFPEDPFTQAAEWPGFASPYGPLSSLVQAGVCLVAGDRVWVGVYAMKLLGALCHLATAWLLYLAVLRRQAAERARRAYYLYLWNPWILLETAGSAHNEAWMAVGLAAALAALARERVFAATTCFGLAVLTKHGIAAIGPYLLALAARLGRLRAFGAGVAATAAVTAGLAVHYFAAEGVLDVLAVQSGLQRTSLQHFAALATGVSSSALTAAGYALTLLFLVFGLRAVRDVEGFGTQSARLIVFFVLVGMPMFSPWYHLWWLPLIGASAWAGWVRVFSWVAVLGPASYLVFATTRTLELGHQVWMWGVGLVPMAALVLVAGWRRGGDRAAAAP